MCATPCKALGVYILQRLRQIVSEGRTTDGAIPTLRDLPRWLYFCDQVHVHGHGSLKNFKDAKLPSIGGILQPKEYWMHCRDGRQRREASQIA